jgi:hypothetical protein
MRASSEKAAASADKMADSAGALKRGIDNFDTSVNKILREVKTDLSTTIKKMDDGFIQSMTEISKRLSGATTDISTSVDKLSKEVKETMDVVRVSIDNSLTQQTRALNGFHATVETLILAVETSRLNLDRIGGNIESGLRAVSESGRRIEYLGGLCKELLSKTEQIPIHTRKAPPSTSQPSSTLPVKAQTDLTTADSKRDFKE